MYEPQGDQREEHEIVKVSILRRKGNVNADVHMKIIKDHNMDMIRKSLYQKLRDLMANKKVIKKSYNFFYKNDEEVKSNNHLIDEYIDEWWILNCPHYYSIA